MIDLSFLTDEEQEAILKVLQRDADLKRIENERVRHLPEKVRDESQVKNMSGQWFYEAKAKRHREKIYGADIVRASIRRKPLTTAGMTPRKPGKTENSWVNNVNKEVLVPPELLEETEGKMKPNQSPKGFSMAVDTLETPKEDAQKPAVSPSKQRKNPFNDASLPEDHAKIERAENGMNGLSEPTGKEAHMPSAEDQPRIGLTPYTSVGSPEQASVGLSEAGKPPVPRARKNAHKTSDVSLRNENPLPKAPRRIKQVNGQGTPPRGILKRSSSSSSTDSEMFRLSQNMDSSNKTGLPASAILEDVPAGEAEGFSQNSLERLKQVRFSSSVSRKGHPPSHESHTGKESGEFSLLDSDSIKTNEGRVSGVEALQSEQSRPATPPQSYSPALNGNAKDRGEFQESGTAPGSHKPSSADPPPGPLQAVESQLAEPSLPSGSSSQACPGAGEAETHEVPPQITTKQPSPESEAFPKSTTDQQLPLAKPEEPQVPKGGSADPEQGKSALAEGQSARTLSKADKYAAEIVKAADESISKVLDWFKRSSSAGGNESMLSAPQERKLAEKRSLHKTRELTVTGEDHGSSPGVLRGKPTSQNDQSRDPVFAKNGRPVSLLVGEERSFTQGKAEETAGSAHQRPCVQTGERAHILTTGQDMNKRDDVGVEGKGEVEDGNTSCGELKVEDKTVKPGLKSADPSFGGAMKGRNSTHRYTDGERDVRSLLEEGNLEQPSGELHKKHKGKESGLLDDENTHRTNQGALLQPHEFKQSSLMGDNRKVKDIRAFWEGEKITPKLANKEDDLNESSSASNTRPTYRNKVSRTKSVGESSGYVTGESDNEQSKSNPVTFRKIELREDVSEPKDDEITLSSGETRKTLMAKSKGSHPADRSGETVPSDQKNVEGTRHPDVDHMHPRCNAESPGSENGPFQGIAFGKERTSPTLHQEPPFKIHSLKQKIDDESKTQMLSPAEFQSLRSFWDVGTKPQSKADEAKPRMVASRSRNSSTGSYLKESEQPKELGTTQAVMGDEQQKFPEERTREPKNSPLEAIRVTSKQAGQLVLSRSMTAVPMGSLEFALTEGNYCEGKAVLPVKEYVEKTVVPSKVQHNLFKRNLQNLLIDSSPESSLVSLPADEEGVAQADGQMPSTDQARQDRVASVDTDGKAELPAREVIETVNQTLVSHKANPDAFKTGLERLLKESADVKTVFRPPIVVDSPEQAVPALEKKRFFNKVMERSHSASPSDQQEALVESQEREETPPNYILSKDQPVKYKAVVGHLPAITKESNSVPEKAPNKEEGQTSLNKIPSQKEAFQIPSLKMTLPEACLATQDSTNAPGKEVFETATERTVPPNKECHDLNAKLVCLLKESRMPCASPVRENILKTPSRSVPGDSQQRLLTEKSILSMPQTAKSSSETGEQSADASKDGGNKLTTEKGEPIQEAAAVFPFRKQKNENALGQSVTVNEQPVDVAETVVKTIKPNSFEHAPFKARLQKLEADSALLKETNGSSTSQATPHPHPNVSPVHDKDAARPQELFETIEKVRAPSNARQAELSASLQRLLKEDSKVLPKSTCHNNGTEFESKFNQTVDSVGKKEIGQGPEINEMIDKTVAPPRLNQQEFCSGVQKLLEEAAQTAKVKDSRQASLGVQSSMDFPAEANETVVKSVAPPNVDAAYNSRLEKLIREGSDAALQMSKEGIQGATGISTPLIKESVSVRMAPPVESTSGDYTSMVKIPFKGKTSQQDAQTVEKAKTWGVHENNAVFQKTIQVNLASTAAPDLQKGKDSPILSRTDDAEGKYGSWGEAETSATPDGSQSASTSLGESKGPLKISKVELLLAASHDGDKDEEDDDDASDLLGENSRSIVGIQRSSTRSEDEINPVLKALKRSSNRQIPSKSLEDIPSATSNKEQVNLPKDDIMLSAEDVSTAPSFPDSQFSNPEKIKMMSKSVPAFLQDEASFYFCTS
ncbi:Synaptotagmin-like protein 2 [Varanus komodoensis]|nr:Synaptotagmin-like protein 2 [Varanus komodoensis]